MRVYVATTPEAIKELMHATVTFEDYLTPEQFEFDAGVDEEEREHLVSLLAADDAIELMLSDTVYVSNKSNTQWFKLRECIKLDNGLNSPFDIDIETFKMIF